jgi:succinate-semialdehyde dehydrogenase/glutarate-semialdehyde dehydrogenase
LARGTPRRVVRSEASVLREVPTRLYIGGEWRSAPTFPVEDPATGEVLAAVANAGPGDALDAVAAADQAFASWRRVAPRERGAVLRRAYEQVIARRDELALLATLEAGKPLSEAISEVDYAASFLRWYSEEAVRINGRFATDENGHGRLMTIKEPIGPCLLITPWNFPLAMSARKLGAALAAGCTCIVKPAEQTPLSTLALARILGDAGLPPGVVNVIPTSHAKHTIESVTKDGRIRKLSFTGSTAVGKALMRQAADQVLRVSMELGGNAPFIVFEDAKIEQAVSAALEAKMRNGGQACTCANRFIVHESIASRFATELGARMATMTVGRGTDSRVDVGPLIDERQLSKVVGLVDDAVAHGAEVLCGARRLKRPGYFYLPTVLTHVTREAAILEEEIFGPVAPIVTFASDQTALELANDTAYGLVAYVFTSDIRRALGVIEELNTGMVAVNKGTVSAAGAPFGGVKHSGFGREGGPEGLEEYLESKYVALDA